MPVWLITLGAKLLPVKTFLKGIPRGVWIAAAAIALLIAGYLWHQHKLHQHDAAIIAAEDARLAKEAAALKAKVDALTANITKLIKDKNDEENRRIAADGATLRVQGPGRASCSRLPATAGGYIPPSGQPDAAGPALPPDDRAAVPWDWLVTRAEEHDSCRAEVIAWHDWYPKMVAAWPKAPK